MLPAAVVPGTELPPSRAASWARRWSPTTGLDVGARRYRHTGPQAPELTAGPPGAPPNRRFESVKRSPADP